MPVRVLVVDDEQPLAEVIARVFTSDGFDTEVAADGGQALSVARRFRPDAVILDIGLPDIDGLTVFARLRADFPHLCVMFLTARDAVEDRVAGLSAGADDYMTKPFSLEELQARLHGLLRRAGAGVTADAGTLRRVGDLTLNDDSLEVRRAEQRINLTPTEFQLLRFLMDNAGRVVSKAEILDHVWEYDFGGQAHVVELYISYLRRKLEADHPPIIKTVRGVGYLLRPPR